ncbi:MAG: hypothetical protein U0Z53_01440 [Blastocatellia bacterium]
MRIRRVIILIITLLFSQATLAQRQPPSIRSVDFSNFKYPGSKGLFPTSEYETQSFTLNKGKSKETPQQYGMTLMGINYGDATGDGIAEAMIDLVVETEGTAVVNHVYIYTLRGGKPGFLWGFESGDRAEGGLKKVYAKAGQLVVELYGRGTQIEGDLNGTEATALCCPRSFTRTRYKWRGNRFRQQGRMEILTLPEKRGTT